MADDPDATLVIQPDEPAFVRAINEMAQTMEARFKKSGDALKTTFQAVTGVSPGQSFDKSPVALVTKEMEKQLKWAKEITKVERDRREIQRARRFETNRMRYGDEIELDENGNVKRRPDMTRRSRATIGGIASGINAFSEFMSSGGSNTGLLNAGSSMLQLAFPELAPIIQSLTGVGTKMFKGQDLFREQALRRYQVGGKLGVDIDEGNLYGSNFWKRAMGLGFNITDFTNMYTRAARGGVFDRDATPQASLDDILQAESSYGIGGNVTSYLGAVGKQRGVGSGTSNDKALTIASGLAFGEGMSQGRLGEIFDQLTNAVQANTKGQADVASIADRMLFVSQLGPQYRGNTNAAREMNQSLQGLAQGSRPFTQLAMLRAAGFGKPGVSYAQAWLRAQTGLDVAGGVKSEDMIKANFSSYVPAYARGNEAQKASIVMNLSLLTGMNGAQVKAIMDRLAKGPLAHVTPAHLTGHAPSLLLKPRRDAAAGTEVTRLGMGSPDYTNQAMVTPDSSGGGGASSSAVAAGGGGASVGGSSQFFGGGEGSYGVKRANTPFHPGIDSNRKLMPGSEVTSPVDGVIVWVQPNGKGVEIGFGLIIKDNATGLFVRIFHLDPKTVDRARIAVGMRVRKGDVLGRIFNHALGRGIPAHVHVGVSNKLYTREKGYKTFDPTSVLDLDSMVRPHVGATKSTSAGAGVTTISSQSVTPSQSNGTTQSTTVGSTTQVTVVIVDKTQHGVDVHHETASYAAQARRAAPGDVPITSPDHKP